MALDSSPSCCKSKTAMINVPSPCTSLESRLANGLGMRPDGLDMRLANDLGMRLANGLGMRLANGLGMRLANGLGMRLANGLGMRLANGLGMRLANGLGMRRPRRSGHETSYTYKSEQLKGKTMKRLTSLQMSQAVCSSYSMPRLSSVATARAMFC